MEVQLEETQPFQQSPTPRLCEFLSKGSRTRGNGENLEPKSWQQARVWLRGLKYVSTKEGEGDQATYEKGQKGPISISKNTG